jgi:peptidoglycan/xylan/chitin deacetylase (PgdA/CDA1 family)
VDARSLMYHDVIGPSAVAASGFPGVDADRYKLDVGLFDRHLFAITRAVTRAGAERIAGVRALTWRKPASPPAVVLHFDDGGASALHVADRLEHTGWRGFFHITTDRIGTPGFVGEADVRELAARGHVIGTHSCSHPSRMSSLPLAEIVREWVDSRARLEQVVGGPVTVGSVPGGFSSPAVIRAADRAGLELVFTSEPTSHFEWVRGCLVLGRYAIRRGMPARVAAELAAGAILPRWEQWASWNAKKALKRLGGRHWLAARARVLASRPRFFV